MTFETFFRLISYAAVFCGFAALWVSGTFGLGVTAVFIGVIIGAWLLEGSRWQISEKVGTALIVLALPIFYLAWRFQLVEPSAGETWVAGVLARMILALTAVKLLQRKSDRDWIFLYLMSFFEVLLAAGLSISTLYLASFIAYLLAMVCAVIAFEIRKTSFSVEKYLAGEAPAKKEVRSESGAQLPFRRLPAAAAVLIVVIVLLALPLFFTLPRVGGAGFGGDQRGLRTTSGFSDTVRLGAIGTIQQGNEIAMRVKFDGEATVPSDLYFRGVVLDTFDNRSWSRSKSSPPLVFMRGERDIIRIDQPASPANLLVQTVYLEPMDTAVLFAVPRVVGVQGGFSVLYRDAYGAIKYPQKFERVSFTAYSDVSKPSVERLRADRTPYTAAENNYRDLPTRYDRRIADLALSVTAGLNNRYDKALAIERYLQGSYGYTLEMKPSGDEPLADFLFNVREGHCEYFATAMAVMLRTQGIATRIVNGFHGGEYNDAAGVTIVRQRNAHSWVEVYFPGEDEWVRFDPTPASSSSGIAGGGGIVATVTKYLEAIETYWIQNFVSYDDQEQRSLAKSVRAGFISYQESLSEFLDTAQAMAIEWINEIRGERGWEARRNAVVYGLAYMAAGAASLILLVWLYRRIRRLQIWNRLRGRLGTSGRSVVEFYERMLALLAARGIIRENHQTPLEFALATGRPEAIKITEAYHRVRFGGAGLTPSESAAVEELLQKMEQMDPN